MVAMQVFDWDYDHFVVYCSPWAFMTSIQCTDLTSRFELHRGIINFIFCAPYIIL
jgi:hypothetical protein